MQSILLADDDSLDVELTLAELEQNHLANKVAVVKDGEEALNFLYCRGKFETREGGNPIVVLLDFKMRKVDGLEVLKTIKADENLKTIPVVLLTSSCEEKDLIRFQESGVNAYLRKPVNFNELMQAVRQIGLFWAALDQQPLVTGIEEAS
jgi:CheY-like chemotaxis protein